MIEIDGSKHEGGGSILRTALALSAITKKPCHIFNIRKRRTRPGLMVQHLASLRTLAELAGANLKGDKLGSEEIWFYPSEIRPKRLEVKIETAGSITLFLQGIIPPSIFSNGSVEIHFKGGATDTFFSPSFDYFRYVFLKNLEKVTGSRVAEIEIKERGFYPEGGAEVSVKIYPQTLKPFNLIEKGDLKKVLLISGAGSFLKAKRVAERQAASAREILNKLNFPLEERIEYYRSKSQGSVINIIAEFENTVIGIDNLGRLGKSAEEIGKEAALKFLNEGSKSKVALDKHMGDQILIFMALSQGTARVTVPEITPHCESNIWVIEKFIKGRFEISENNIVSWHKE